MPGQRCDDSVNSHTQIRVLLGNTSETWWDTRACLDWMFTNIYYEVQNIVDVGDCHGGREDKIEVSKQMGTTESLRPHLVSQGLMSRACSLGKAGQVVNTDAWCSFKSSGVHRAYSGAGKWAEESDCGSEQARVPLAL